MNIGVSAASDLCEILGRREKHRDGLPWPCGREHLGEPGPGRSACADRVGLAVGVGRQWEQPRWAGVFAEGLTDAKTANVWADEIWCPLQEETDDNEDL
jgi:hypothetical protein